MKNITKKMKKVIVILIMSLCYSLGFAQNINIQTITENEYHLLKDQQIDNALDTLLSIKEENDFIYIPLDNGFLTLMNDTLEEHLADLIIHKCLGFSDAFNVYVMDVTKFTHNETWFIDKSNGNIVKALRFYCCSDKYIVSYDIPECDRYVGVNIYRKTKNGLEKMYCIKPDWFIENMFCIGENVFVAEARTLSITENLFFKIVL